jgi:hypothetical protein
LYQLRKGAAAGKLRRLRAGMLVTITLSATLVLSNPTSVIAESVTGMLPLTVTASTIAADGDRNPHGVAFVPARFPPGGVLNPGDVLISDFDNKDGKPGLGVSIVRITQAGQQSTFFQGSGVGLTGLWVLRAGFVLVASLPTLDGTTATVQQGSLLVIDKNGALVSSVAEPRFLSGPWELTVFDKGQTALVFVSNVLTGTVTRLVLTVNQTATGQTVTASDLTQIASGYAHRLDPTVLVVGPSGLAYDPRQDTLFVASTSDNAIFRVANAGKTKADGGVGAVLFNDQVHLHGPLGIVIGLNGHLFAANSNGTLRDPRNASDFVELTVRGRFIAQQAVDPRLGGAFSIDFTGNETGAKRLAWIDANGSRATLFNLCQPEYGTPTAGLFSPQAQERVRDEAVGAEGLEGRDSAAPVLVSLHFSSSVGTGWPCRSVPM